MMVVEVVPGLKLWKLPRYSTVDMQTIILYGREYHLRMKHGKYGLVCNTKTILTKREIEGMETNINPKLFSWWKLFETYFLGEV